MTSYEFEIAAKNALIKVLKSQYGIDATIDMLNFVWFTHVLGYKKACIYGLVMGKLYAEVTYNLDNDDMYVDVYTKTSNVKFTKDDMDFVAHYKK